jgi:hypothetical protein
MDNDIDANLFFNDVYISVFLLAKTDRYAQAAVARYMPRKRMEAYVDSVIANPNQTQVAQRIYARAVAERLERK